MENLLEMKISVSISCASLWGGYNTVVSGGGLDCREKGRNGETRLLLEGGNEGGFWGASVELGPNWI